MVYEAATWAIDERVFGRNRLQAVEELLHQMIWARSDGMVCAYKESHERLGPLCGSCMCGRLLMMLHDISYEEVSVKMFIRLLEHLAASAISPLITLRATELLRRNLP